MQSFLLSERERLGLKQKDVFEFIGVNKATYYRWESGNPIPSDKLNELSKLGFDVNYVVTGKRGSANSINKNNYDRAMRIVMLYAIKTDRQIADADMFVQVVNEVYQVLEKCDQEDQEVDQIEIGAKVIRLFAA